MAQNRETRNLLQLLRNRELGVRKPLRLSLESLLLKRTHAMEYAVEVAGDDFLHEDFCRICNVPLKGVRLVRECYDRVYEYHMNINNPFPDLSPSPPAISPRMQSPPPSPPPPPPPPPQHRAWLEDFEREDRCKYLYLLFYNKN